MTLEKINPRELVHIMNLHNDGEAWKTCKDNYMIKYKRSRILIANNESWTSYIDQSPHPINQRTSEGGGYKHKSQ